MSSETTIQRLRRANPVPAVEVENEELFAAIVAGPADERLTRTSFGGPRESLGRVAIVLVALTVGASVAWAAVDGPLQLFQSNPQGRDAGPASVWHQDVIPASVIRAAVVPVPRVGEVEFWYAEARQGGWCGAIRLPNGDWAGTKGTGGGTAAGCYPTREQVNGDDPVYVINGFDYYEVQIDAREDGGSFWRVRYGIVSGRTPAVRVVDRVSGRSARVRNGAFAIALRDADPDRTVPLPGSPQHLVAYDASGGVVADERVFRE